MIEDIEDIVTDWYKVICRPVNREKIHNIPVIKNGKVIGVCIDYKDSAYRCEIWDRSITVEIDAETKQISGIVLKEENGFSTDIN